MSSLVLCICSGLALAVAFPTFGLSLLAWISLVPPLFAIEFQSLRRVFFYGWVLGLAFFIAMLY